ncbi:hypothetical protein [Nocardia abscessus]|uniref:hypothetical protein n=1 Tax=Nocardia abscessus TaxID=120957 RepID=UPI002457BDA6|nr:hypothetical protein [Nocardia abscessus]
MVSRYLAGVLRNLADRIDPPPRRGRVDVTTVPPGTIQYNFTAPDPEAARGGGGGVNAGRTPAAAPPAGGPGEGEPPPPPRGPPKPSKQTSSS